MTKDNWQPIETAPRDGTEIELTWMDDGVPQEIWLMRWSAFATNPLVQNHKGIWAMRNVQTGALICTWSEANQEGAPTHWRTPKYETTECNLPFDRLPACACDKGRSSPPTRLQILECKIKGGPCSEFGNVTFEGGIVVWLKCPECNRPTIDPETVTCRDDTDLGVTTSGMCAACGVVAPPWETFAKSEGAPQSDPPTTGCLSPQPPEDSQ